MDDDGRTTDGRDGRTGRTEDDDDGRTGRTGGQRTTTTDGRNITFQIQHWDQNSNQNLVFSRNPLLEHPQRFQDQIPILVSDALHDAHGPEAVGVSF